MFTHKKRRTFFFRLNLVTNVFVRESNSRLDYDFFNFFVSPSSFFVAHVVFASLFVPFVIFVCFFFIIFSRMMIIFCELVEKCLYILSIRLPQKNDLSNSIKKKYAKRKLPIQHNTHTKGNSKWSHRWGTNEKLYILFVYIHMY